jgi:hypothetical protein
MLNNRNKEVEAQYLQIFGKMKLSKEKLLRKKTKISQLKQEKNLL